MNLSASVGGNCYSNYLHVYLGFRNITKSSVYCIVPPVHVGASGEHRNEWKRVLMESGNRRCNNHMLKIDKGPAIHVILLGIGRLLILLVCM